MSVLKKALNNVHVTGEVESVNEDGAQKIFKKTVNKYLADIQPVSQNGSCNHLKNYCSNNYNNWNCISQIKNNLFLGLFIIGNMSTLVKKNSIWPSIKKVLESENNIDNYLTLKCQIHPNQLTKIQKPEDFQKVIEGGCALLCNKELNCGHSCSRLCHVQDREHIEHKCKEPCTK